MSDLNKTHLTEQTTQAAILWLREKGFKPVQTEVRITDGWVADIAGVLKPTQTEMLDLKIIGRPPKWRQENRDATVAWTETVRAMKKIPLTGLVEVKTSRADFTGDQKWGMPIPVNLAYLAVPKGLIAEHEFPAGWGILEYADGAVRARRFAPLASVPAEAQRDVIFEVTTRLFNTTDSYTVTLKNHWREERDRFKMKRLSEIIAGVCSIVESSHEDFDVALSFAKLPRVKLTALELERLKLLHGLGRRVYESIEKDQANRIRGKDRVGLLA